MKPKRRTCGWNGRGIEQVGLGGRRAPQPLPVTLIGKVPLRGVPGGFRVSSTRQEVNEKNDNPPVAGGAK